jgi:PAS domain S-box-containing protein
MEKRKKSETSVLRQKAEGLLKKKQSESVQLLSEAETQKLIHELDVHQIELELQNDELKLAISAAHDAIELYDFAPLGYFTLSREGKILFLNFSGSQMLGRERSLLKNSRFDFFVSNDTRAIFNLFIGKVFISKVKETCEVMLLINGNQPMNVHLTGIVTEKGEHCLVTVVDITERQKAEMMALQNEKRYRNLFETASDCIFIIDETTSNFVDSNTAASMLYGYSKEEFLLMKVRDISAEPEKTEATIRGKITRVPLRLHRRKDGTIFSVEITGSYFMLGERKLHTAFICDITNRKHAQDIINQTEENFRSSLEESPLGARIVTAEGDTIFANRAILDIYGYESVEELRNTPVRNRYTKESYAEFRKRYAKRQRGEELLSEYEISIVRKNREIRHLQVFRKMVLWDCVRQFQVMYQDITKRRDIEKTLEQQNNALSKLNHFAIELAMLSEDDRLEAFITKRIKEFAGARAAVFSEFNPETRSTTVTHIEIEQGLLKKVIGLLGKQLGDIHSVVSDEMYKEMTTDLIVMRMNLYEASFGAISRPVSAAIMALLKVDRFIAVVYLIEGKLHGTSLLAMAKDQPDPSRQILENFVFLASVSLRRKQSEDKIKQKNVELQKINIEKDKFFSIIAHDLRNPFNLFLGFTKLMAEEMDTLSIKEIHDISSTMRSVSTNLYRLLENLLNWARMQQGLTPFNPEVVQLLLIVNECLSTVLDTAKDKGIEIASDIPGSITVFADIKMLQTVFRNLVSNAVKFTANGGKVDLSAKVIRDKTVEISVIDTGIGMNDEMVDNLFRLDVQTNREGTNGEPSTGLGLMISKDFIEKQGGKLWVKSEEGKGSDFKFTLPNRQ